MVSLKWPLTLCVQLTVLISWTCIIYCVAGYWVCFWWQREGLWWGCGLPVWHKTHCFIKHTKNILYAFLVFPLSSSIDEGNRPRLLCKIGISPRRFQRDWFNQLSHIIIVWISWYSKFSTSERTDPVQFLRCLPETGYESGTQLPEWPCSCTALPWNSCSTSTQYTWPCSNGL